MTVQPLGIHLDAGSHAAIVAAEVVASLPVSFHVDAQEDAAATVVDGNADGWLDLVADRVEEGSRLAVVIDPLLPSRPARQAVSAFADRVVLSEPWAGNPALAAVRESWGPTSPDRTWWRSPSSSPCAAPEPRICFCGRCASSARSRSGSPS